MTEGERARPGTFESPIEPGTRPIFHRAYHFELHPKEGGGFGQGEVLLRSDGVLFTRTVSRGMGNRPDGPTSTWRRDSRWDGGPDGNALWTWLERRGYAVGGSVFPIASDVS